MINEVIFPSWLRPVLSKYIKAGWSYDHQAEFVVDGVTLMPIISSYGSTIFLHCRPSIGTEMRPITLTAQRIQARISANKAVDNSRVSFAVLFQLASGLIGYGSILRGEASPRSIKMTIEEFLERKLPPFTLGYPTAMRGIDNLGYSYNSEYAGDWLQQRNENLLSPKIQLSLEGVK